MSSSINNNPYSGEVSLQNTIKQEDFYLLDVLGGASVTAMHPTRPVVAYSSGNAFNHLK